MGIIKFIRILKPSQGNVFIKPLVLFVSMVISTVYGQKNDIESIHFLKGNWEVENHEWTDNQWKSIGKTHSETKLEYDGRFTIEKVKYLSKHGAINMTTSIGYDSRLKKFKLCAMDKEYGYMDIYFGEWVNDNLVFTNLESDIPVKLDDGRELSFRLTYSKIDNKAFTHLVEGTFDKGKTWFYFSKGIYTKKQA